MSNERQYVACRFNPRDQRIYTFHNDGAPVAIGDKVKVETRDGAKIVEVVSIGATAPSFPTKPVIEKVIDEPASSEGNN